MNFILGISPRIGLRVPLHDLGTLHYTSQSYFTYFMVLNVLPTSREIPLNKNKIDPSISIWNSSILRQDSSWNLAWLPFRIRWRRRRILSYPKQYVHVLYYNHYESYLNQQIAAPLGLTTSAGNRRSYTSNGQIQCNKPSSKITLYHCDIICIVGC